MPGHVGTLLGGSGSLRARTVSRPPHKIIVCNLHAPMNMTQVSSQVWNGGLQCAIDIRIILV
eukprot:COSAG02_NODE_33085_length_505_cov_1.413793_1_plen_61_part_01